MMLVFRFFSRKMENHCLANVKSLSGILLEHFKPMIPQLYQDLWQEGINSNALAITFKLCGSGGGGFI